MVVRYVHIIFIGLIVGLAGCASQPKSIEVKKETKVVVYGFDGTSQNIRHGSKTNVFRFLLAHHKANENAVSAYSGGVGTEKSFKFNVSNIPGLISGEGGRAIIEDMYKQLVHNYKQGRTGIVIVGFSRGAAISREFAHVIKDRGDPLLYEKGKEPRGAAPEIQFMALFDTVYSFGSPAGKKDLEYRKSIAPNVRAVAHATASEEKRNTFDLWSIHEKEELLNTTPPTQNGGKYRAEKEYYAGHDDVGGARKYGNYSYEPLKWVIEEGIKSGLALSLPSKTDYRMKSRLNPKKKGFGKRQIYFPNSKVESSKVLAITKGKAKKGCEGKQTYLSGTSCYTCPAGYKRHSFLRKMTHPKACTERGIGRKTKSASYAWEANGCKKGQFKHRGQCKICPKGSKREHTASFDTGYCIN